MLGALIKWIITNLLSKYDLKIILKKKELKNWFL